MCRINFSDSKRKKIADTVELDGNKIMEEKIKMVELPNIPVYM